MEMNNFVGHPRGHDYRNNVGQVHHISKEKWKQAKDYSQEKDDATNIFGEKPSPEQIMERYKGVVYQREKHDPNQVKSAYAKGKRFTPSRSKH